MINLKYFKIFESGPDYSIEEIKKLPVYKILTSLGWSDATTPLIWKNKNMRLLNPRIGSDDVYSSFTIYSNGPIRRSINGRQAILKRFNSGISSIEDWTPRFLYLIIYTLKKLGAYGKTLAKEIRKNGLDNYPEIISLFYINNDPEAFSSLYYNASPEDKIRVSEILGLDGSQIDKGVEMQKKAKKIIDYI